MNSWYSRIDRLAGWIFVLLLIPSMAAGQAAPDADEPPAYYAEADAPEESVLSDPFVKEEGKRGLDLLYNMRFEEANAIFEEIDQRHPDHPIGPFLKALNTWWQILLDLSDDSYDDTFYDEMERVIERAESMPDEYSFDASFFKSVSYGLRGRLRSNRSQWLRAALDGRRALSHVQKLADEAPDNPDFAFGEGVYNYYVELLPEQYPFARPFMVFFPDGNKEEGLSQLEHAAQNGWYIRAEASYFLLQIYHLYENDFSKSREYVRYLRNQYPDNPFFHAFEGRVFARWGRWDRARSVYSEVLERYEAEQTGYNDYIAEQALYYLGRERMSSDAYDEALQYLLQLEALSSRDGGDESPFRVLGRLRQGMIYDARGNRPAAEQRYREVLQMDDASNAHDRAQQYLDEPYGG